jgi:hypothetical protein
VQFELNISVFDLQVIFINLVDTNQEVYLKFRDRGEFDEPFIINNYDYSNHIVRATTHNRQSATIEFSVEQIDQIEFESHYNYRGESAKILKVI